MSQVFHNASTPGFALVGANGFIGSHLRELAREREISHCDFTRQHPATNAGVAHPDLLSAPVVVWAASMITPATAEESPEAVSAERSAFSELVTSLANSPRDHHLVVMSSGGTVYGGNDAPYVETDVPQPVNRYGAAKLALENIAHGSGVPTTVLRVANAYGPGQQAARGQGVIGYWLRALRDKKPISIFGNGSTVRDYVYVKDIAEAVLAAASLTSPEPFRIINIGSGEPTTLTQLARLCLDVAGADSAIKYQENRGFDTPANWLDVRTALDYLNWEPTVTLRDGLRLTWEWVQTAD